ncbi:MAG: plastocyanin/DNA/RNA endonuclease YhcR with UshA esterase domain [Polaribacter sp.]
MVQVLGVSLIYQIIQNSSPMFKKLPGLFIALFLFCTTLNAQVVITEIFYNAPGTDTIEYIELYNNSGAALNLEGYNFTEGITFAFPSYMLNADEYVVVANNADAMMGFFGITALQWTTGGLNNSGEDLQLNNADTTMVVDFLDYDDGTFWPSEADGDGFSMELCDPSENNADPSNWYPSATNANIVLMSVPIFGSPGAENEIVCNPASVTVTSSGLVFTPADVTIFAGQTVEWMNISGNHNANGSIATFPGNAPEDFTSGPPSSANWTYSYTFNTPGTYDYQCDLHVGAGMVGTVTVIPVPTYDIVINEIMYNPPSSDLIGEYIELYNNQNTAIDLAGFEFTQGVEYTFPSLSIGAGEYLMVASDSVAFEALYGVPARQWTSGGLSNSGEEIVLEDNLGNQVDVVIYDNNSPYAEIANGEGPSLVLCDPSADNNNPTNWSHSINNTNVIPAGSNEFVFASPGAANNCPSGPQLFFNGITGTVGEGEMVGTFSIRMPVLTTTDSADVEIIVDGLTTATEGIDFSIISTTLHFSPDSPGEISEAEVQIGLIDDLEIEGDETIVLQMQNASGATIATTGLYTITIEDNDGNVYPTYPVGTVTTNGIDEVADSIGVQCSLTGIVHNLNLTNNILQFTIIDQNENGIGVYSDSSAFDYTVTQGDLITIDGVIEQFRGLTQIVPDTIKVLSPGAPLFDPNIVTTLDESTESQIVRLNNMSIVDLAEWTNSGSGFNVTITDGTNEVEMRIDADTDIYGTSPPTGMFDVIGIGGQFKFSAPFDEGYQLIPRYLEDIMEAVNPNLQAVDDVAVTGVDQPITIDILANDNLPNMVTNVVFDAMPSFGSAVINTDFTITYSPNLGFCGMDALSYTVCDNMMVCETAVVTITVECPSAYPLYDIAVVTTNDTEGISDSIDISCELRGVVYGVNMNANGLQFTIIDENDPDAGIGVFDGGDTFGYTVNEGDLVACQGEIGQFNGLTQIYVDSVYVVSTGATLHNPATITSLDESAESKLVKIFNVTLEDATQWTGAGPGFNVTVTDGTNQFQVRIDNDVSLYSLPAPTGTLNITGIGGQFDFDSPYDEGYQLLPRYTADIEMAIATDDIELEAQVSIFPNPTAGVLFVNAPEVLDGITVYNQLGQLVYVVEDISNNNMIDTESFPVGMYVIRMEKDGKVWGKNFVKE